MQEQQQFISENQNTAVSIPNQESQELQDVISRYLPLFCRMAYRYVGDYHDAEDAVQDALLSAYKHLDQFKGKAKMTTWLTSIVTNSALTKLRRRPRQIHLSLDERLAEEQGYCVADTVADARPNPEIQFFSSERQRALVQSVSRLSPALRQAIQLHDFDGLTTREIASALGVPDGTVKARVSRARTKLKQLMCAV
jgi:RNA polymerase sigma-70 factor (ECF subfamily)